MNPNSWFLVNAASVRFADETIAHSFPNKYNFECSPRIPLMAAPRRSSNRNASAGRRRSAGTVERSRSHSAQNAACSTGSGEGGGT